MPGVASQRKRSDVTLVSLVGAAGDRFENEKKKKS